MKCKASIATSFEDDTNFETFKDLGNCIMGVEQISGKATPVLNIPYTVETAGSYALIIELGPQKLKGPIGYYGEGSFTGKMQLGGPLVIEAGSASARNSTVEGVSATGQVGVVGSFNINPRDAYGNVVKLSQAEVQELWEDAT